MQTSQPSRKPWVLAHLLLSAVLWTGGVVLIARRSPGLIRERTLPGPGAMESMGEEAVLYALPTLAHAVLAAFDRPGTRWWRPMPTGLHLLGFVAYAACNVLVIWSELTNPFFSSAIRIQPDRGQHVVSDGPYAFVRHPGYLAGSLIFVSSALSLGSWLSMLPGVFFSLAIVRRARLEDAFLEQHLPGYTDYANRVRYRLFPGIW
jgi:protein-S-isoprenylcysteine O-methyltransferase Ste14